MVDYMKNYFYSNEIATRIRDLINENISEEAAKNISVGDFSILPYPDKLVDYLPAVIISTDTIENKFANESSSVSYTPYYFSIYYIYSYTYEGDSNAERDGKKYAQEIANVLMNFRTLNDFKILASEIEVGGLVVSSMLSNIDFDNTKHEFFRSLEIPAHISKIEFCVGFRTYQQ